MRNATLCIVPQPRIKIDLSSATVNLQHTVVAGRLIVLLCRPLPLQPNPSWASIDLRPGCSRAMPSSCAFHTCRNSTNAAHRLICYSCVVVQLAVALKYIPHVSQMDRRCPMADFYHVCFCVHVPSASACATSLYGATAPRGCTGMLALTYSRTHAQMPKRTHVRFDIHTRPGNCAIYTRGSISQFMRFARLFVMHMVVTLSEISHLQKLLFDVALIPFCIT